MTRFIKPALLGTTAILFTAGLALAAPKADTNNDGQITEAEFLTEANLKFINIPAMNAPQNGLTKSTSTATA